VAVSGLAGQTANSLLARRPMRERPDRARPARLSSPKRHRARMPL